ncbi:hypothetical protein OAS86_04685, partial [Gammaproteobacteria bacterium]|nr:hypothetical protein [Gammaproteobacteria bacterium]
EESVWSHQMIGLSLPFVELHTLTFIRLRLLHNETWVESEVAVLPNVPRFRIAKEKARFRGPFHNIEVTSLLNGNRRIA